MGRRAATSSTLGARARDNKVVREKNSDSGRSWRDLGGLPVGEIDRGAHDVALWEERVDALMAL